MGGAGCQPKVSPKDVVIGGWGGERYKTRCITNSEMHLSVKLIDSDSQVEHQGTGNKTVKAVIKTADFFSAFKFHPSLIFMGVAGCQP